MQQLIEFSIRHWELSLAFLAILMLLLGSELRGRLWGLRQLSAHEVTLLINREDGVVVDIRGRELFNKGHIGGALNIPFDEFAHKIEQLKKHKDKPLILVYATGQSLTQIKGLLKNQGFNRLACLKGGIVTWQNAGLPLVKAG